MTFAARSAKHRIALLGDSFTFGLGVRYEDTWGHQLELLLGRDYQVLNFGVDGYGVDQAYLRYYRDVRAWHPEIVVLGMIDDDLRRTMCVYGFLCFPKSDMPFSKPRFVMSGSGLRLLNLPLTRPDSMFAKQSIEELPFVEHDGSFEASDWDWHFYHSSYVVRLVLSTYRGFSIRPPMVSEEALQAVNGELLRAFVRVARERGSTLMVVFFPSALDFGAGVLERSIARRVLHAERIPYVDMTDCVRKVDSGRRFQGSHYSAVTNAAVARCIYDSITVESRLAASATGR